LAELSAAGAQVELASVHGVERLKLAARLSVIFAAELAGIASTAGFGEAISAALLPRPSHRACAPCVSSAGRAGLRAWRTYRALPGGVGGGAGGGPGAVRVVRDVRSARSSPAVCGSLTVKRCNVEDRV
jgi:hypothetical protein